MYAEEMKHFVAGSKDDADARRRAAERHESSIRSARADADGKINRLQSEIDAAKKELRDQ